MPVMELENSGEAKAEKCISCMSRDAIPHNGGLCGTCAPPLKTPSRKWNGNHKIVIKVRKKNK
jgi:hypothetical protein